MNRQQKIAWFQLVVIAVAAAAGVINSGLYMHKYGYTFLKAWWLGMAWPVVLCLFLVVIAPLFFRKKKGQINFDERDIMIDHKAMRITFATSYAFFIAVCMTTWVAVGFDEPIPAYWLVRIVLGGGVISMMTNAMATIVYYSWAGKGEN